MRLPRTMTRLTALRTALLAALCALSGLCGTGGRALAQTNVAMQLTAWDSKAQSTTGVMPASGLSSITLQCWLRWDGTGSVETYPMAVASSQANLNNGSSFLGLKLSTTSGALLVRLWIGSGSYSDYNAIAVGTNLTANAWYHVTVTEVFNEGGVTVVRTYVRDQNGNLLDPDNSGDGITRQFSLATAVTVAGDRYIGMSGYSTSSTSLKYSIADVRFWRTALDTATIAANWNRRLDVTEMASSSLQAYYYPTEQGAGDTALEAEDTGGPTLTMAGTWTWVQGPPQLNAAPAAPVLTSTGHNASSVGLDWNDVSGADSYTVYRDGALLQSGVATSSWLDQTCVPNTEYDYAVKACAGVACSADSNTVTVTTDPDTTAPTPGAVTLTSRSHDGLVVNVGAGSDDVGVTSREIQVYTDEALQNRISEGEAVVGDNALSGLDEATTYWVRVVYLDAALNSAEVVEPFTTTVYIPPTPYALHLGRGVGWGVTGPLFSWGDIKAWGGLTVLIRAKADLFHANDDLTATGATSIMELRHNTLAAKPFLFDLSLQNSPYMRSRLGARAGTTHLPGALSQAVIYPGTPAHKDYVDLLISYQPPDGTNAGRYTVHWDGAIPKESQGGTYVDFDFTIPADYNATTLLWQDADLFKLFLGNETNPIWGMYFADVAVWKGYKDTAFAQGIKRTALNTIAGDLASDNTCLLWYQPTGEAWKAADRRVRNNSPAAVALADADMVFTGEARLDAGELPSFSLLYEPHDTTPPTVATDPYLGAFGDTTVTVEVPDLGADASDTVERTVYLTKRNADYRDIYIQRTALGASDADASFSGLQPGTRYAVVVEYLDLFQNATTFQVPFTTTGTLADVYRRSFHVQGSTTEVIGQPVYFPMDVDALSASFWVKREVGDAGVGSFFVIDDTYSLGTPSGNYMYLSAGMDVDPVVSYVGMGIGTGSKVSGYGGPLYRRSNTTIPIGEWQHWIMGIEYPTPAQEGWVRYYQNGTLVHEAKFSDAMTGWSTDWTPAKYQAQIALPRSGNASADYKVADLSFYTEYPAALAAAISGLGPDDIPSHMLDKRVAAWGSVKDSGNALATDGYAVGSLAGYVPATGQRTAYTGTTAVAAITSEDLPAGWPLVATPPVEPNVVVRPMARAAAFTFSLDDLGLYNPTNYGYWKQPGDARLYWSDDDGVTWNRGQDFERVQTSRYTETIADGETPDPRMASMLVGLEEGVTYKYKVTLSGGDYPLGTPDVTGDFTTLTSTPTVGAVKNTVLVSSSTTSSQLKTAVDAAFAGTSPYSTPASHVEIALDPAQHPDPAQEVTIRAAVYGYNVAGSGVLRKTGTASAWKALTVAAGHNIRWEGSNATYDTTATWPEARADLWEPYTDASRAITAPMSIYKSVAKMAQPWAVRYQRESSPGVWEEHSITLLNMNSGQKSDMSYSGGYGLAVAANIYGYLSSSTRLEVWTDQSNWARLSPGDTAMVAGTGNAAFDGLTFTVTSTYFGPSPDKTGDKHRIRFSGTGLPTVVWTKPAAATVTPTETYYNSFRWRALEEGASWLWDEDPGAPGTGWVHLRLPGGIDPDTVRIKVKALDNAMDVWDSSYLVVDGFKFYNFGGQLSGVGLSNSEYLVFRNMTVSGCGQGFTAKYDTSNKKRNIVIKNVQVVERGLGADPDDPTLPFPQWSWVKASTQERIGVTFPTNAFSLLDSTIRGTFNGWHTPGLNWSSTNWTRHAYPEAVELDNNLFLGIGDDAIEPEQRCVNLTFTRNRFVKCYKGVSTAPATGGPVYVLRNTFYGAADYLFSEAKQAFLKLGLSTPGDTSHKLIAHNTVVNHNPDTSGIPQVGIANTAMSTNLHIYNNYFDVDGYPVDFGFPAGLGYPHHFNRNRYRLTRQNAYRPGYNNSFALASYAQVQGDTTANASHRASGIGETGFLNWQKGANINASMTDWPGWDGAVKTAPVYFKLSGDTKPMAGYYSWLHDPDSTYTGPDAAGWNATPELEDPAAGDFTPTTTSGWPTAEVLYGVNADLGPGWSAYQESTVTVGAVPYAPLGNQAPAVSIPSYRAAVGRDIVATVTATDDAAVAAFSGISVTGPGGPVAYVLGSPQGIGTPTATVTVTFTASAPGAYTVEATATDDEAADGAGSGVSHARRATGVSVITGG